MEQLQSAEQALAAARTEIQVLIERTTQREDKIEHLQQTLEKLDQVRAHCKLYVASLAQTMKGTYPNFGFGAHYVHAPKRCSPVSSKRCVVG